MCFISLRGIGQQAHKCHLVCFRAIKCREPELNRHGHSNVQRILSPLRLPIPPSRRNHIKYYSYQAAPGFAPGNSGFADRRLSYLAMPPKAGDEI